MKPDLMDALNKSDLSSNTAGQIIIDSIEEPKRGKEYNNMATYIMQLPKRFYSFWVLLPNRETNYIGIFDSGIRKYSYNDKLISSPWEVKSGYRFPVRDYSWLLSVLLGSENVLPLFPALKIGSINHDYNSICSMLDCIMADGDIKLNDFWRVTVDLEQYVFSQYDMTVWLSFLKAKIPVRVVDESEMPNIALPYRDGRDDNDSLRTMDCLGMYCLKNEAHKSYKVKNGVWHNETNGRVLSLKEIRICSKRIKEYADNYGIPFNNLVIIVYLHELAHAALDPLIHAKEEKLNNDDKAYSIDFEGTSLHTSQSISAFAMEESLANMIMLKYLEWYSEVESDYKELFEDAECFVRSQISEYCFGLKQFAADVDWRKWREYKSKPNKPDEKLDEWYRICFNRGSVANYTKDIFDNVFK